MRRGNERGQGTVEWVGLVAIVALLLVAFVAARGGGAGAGAGGGTRPPVRGRTAADCRLRKRGRQARPRAHPRAAVRAPLPRPPGRLPSLSPQCLRRPARERVRPPYRYWRAGARDCP